MPEVGSTVAEASEAAVDSMAVVVATEAGANQHRSPLSFPD
jgi:hypothetical protein